MTIQRPLTDYMKATLEARYHDELEKMSISLQESQDIIITNPDILIENLETFRKDFQAMISESEKIKLDFDPEPDSILKDKESDTDNDT